ncbi:Uncharacterised protein [Serratia grimesii]|nr:Uncharacterised protein [Serratia grimesii]CAI1532075.1 Uncharacterised protein [Serratia grimesii]
MLGKEASNLLWSNTKDINNQDRFKPTQVGFVFLVSSVW